MQFANTQHLKKLSMAVAVALLTLANTAVASPAPEIGSLT